MHAATRWLRAHPLLELAVGEARLSWNELDANAGRALERTDVLQPVLTALSLAVHAALRAAGVTPALLLGHSLGEVPALAAAGALSSEDAVRLAAKRGALMAREAARHPGGLIAVHSEDEAQRLLLSHPGLRLAARNAPDEVVLSGLAADLPASARRVPVSGPWHHDAMADAVAPFRAALDAVPHHAPLLPCVRNLDGAPGLTVDALADQLTRPVEFTRCLSTARALGADTFVTVGPGLVLRGLVRKTLGAGVRVLTTEDAADLARTLAALQGTP